VETIELLNTKTGLISSLEVNGVFISVGTDPDTRYLKGIIPLDESGYIITNENMETQIPGVLAAGDVRHNSARQAITAAGDGATAAIYAQKYLTESIV
jgi:thioredoxin reductase (NADPH)